MSDLQTYTVGWICAISTEYLAAQAFLDEIHDGPEFVSTNDYNDYTLGKIGRHNVVIAVLPDGEYGTASAAVVARDMLHSFPNVRIGLMVGIGGGAPSSRHDIRLGDIVVSAPRNGSGGVFQYDFGKTVQDQRFLVTRHMDQPPSILRTAVAGLRTQYEGYGHKIKENIDDILVKNKRLRKKYGRPSPEDDKLFIPSVVHPYDDDGACGIACSGNPSDFIIREERDEDGDDPAVHYGLIASANQLMKDAVLRDKLSTEKDVLCFEMEAAGLMNHFPCLIVRGVCDYSDTHKNKEWQGYAAMTAAAYAKDLLFRIAPNKIEAEKKLSDIVAVINSVRHIAEDHKNVAEDHKGISQKQLKIMEDAAQKQLSDRQKECFHLFRLTTSDRDTTYEWYKDRVHNRLVGTCTWVLGHDHFQAWVKQDAGPLLISADPGCGKSVLAKYLIDHVLPGSSSICYFFFKDMDQNTVRQALCAILHQLFSKTPDLIKHAMPHFEQNGVGLLSSTSLLWAIFESIVQDLQVGSIVIILDALDECTESELEDLVQKIKTQSYRKESGFGKLKYLLTSRPYEQIMSRFRTLARAFPRIRIPGEDDSETISQEVNHVIRYRVENLASMEGLSVDVTQQLEGQLLSMKHRTYLWVYLVFNHLKTGDFKRTRDGVTAAIETLPESINQAYEQILTKSRHQEMVRKILSIVLAADRPLTLGEMNVAVNISSNTESLDNIDLEDVHDFKKRLRSLCGLFVSINDNKIYFLHQTAREFLLTDLSTGANTVASQGWNRSISMRQAHAKLAELCLRFLSFFRTNPSLLQDAEEKVDNGSQIHAFVDYSACFWSRHFREAHIDSKNVDLVSLALELSDPTSKLFPIWFPMHCKSLHTRDPGFSSTLGVASFLGHHAVAESLLRKGVDLESTDAYNRHTPLLWAMTEDHENVAELLLDKGADVNARSREYGSALGIASETGYGYMVELLLDKGADLNVADKNSRTPLHAASSSGRSEVVKLLIDKGADLAVADISGRTPLHEASSRDCLEVVKLLLDKGADLTVADNNGWTPLYEVSRSGQLEVVKLLLMRGADPNIAGKGGRRPLCTASTRGHLEIVKLLLDKGADLTAADNDGSTPLHGASSYSHLEVVKLLLDKGADLSVADNDGWTPLTAATSNSYFEVSRLLLKNGAFKASGGLDLVYGTIANMLALKGHTGLLRFIVMHNNADLLVEDRFRRTPLKMAATGGHLETFRYLKEETSEISTSGVDWDLVNCAASGGSLEILSLALQDQAGTVPRPGHWNPLHWACRAGATNVVEALIDWGLEGNGVYVPEMSGFWTPLAIAIFNGKKNMLDNIAEHVKAALGTGNEHSYVKGQRYHWKKCSRCFHVSVAKLRSRS